MRIAPQIPENMLKVESLLYVFNTLSEGQVEHWHDKVVKNAHVTHLVILYRPPYLEGGSANSRRYGSLTDNREWCAYDRDNGNNTAASAPDRA